MSAPTNTAPAEDIRPIHQAFSWVPSVAENNQEAHFAALTFDICNGVKTCLELVQSTDMALHARALDDDDGQPLLSRVDREHLVLLATAAVRMLGQQAFQRADYLNDQARKAAAARNGGGA